MILIMDSEETFFRHVAKFLLFSHGSLNHRVIKFKVFLLFYAWIYEYYFNLKIFCCYRD